jgi:hypothetical protein
MSTHSERLREAEATLYRTLVEHPDLAHEVAERSGRLANFRLEGNLLSFTLERHPHMLGRQSKGMPSAGSFVVEQHYVFDLDQKTISLTQERCTGWEADIEVLVREDIEMLLDWQGGFEPYKDCPSEEAVRLRAEPEADSIVELLPDSTLLMPDQLFALQEGPQLWQKFCEDFMEQWRSTYIAMVIEKWQEWQEDNEDFA